MSSPKKNLNNKGFFHCSPAQCEPNPWLTLYCFTYRGIFVGNEMGPCCFGMLFCVGFCSFCCCGFSRIHSCGYQVSSKAFEWNMPEFQTTNWSLEDRVCWKSNIRKKGWIRCFGVRGNEHFMKSNAASFSRAPHPLWIQLQHFVNELRISLRHIALSSHQKLTKMMRKISWDSNWIGASQILSPTDSTTNDWHWHSIPCQQKTHQIRMSNASNHHSLGDHGTSGSPLSFRRRSIPMVIPLHFLFKQQWMFFLPSSASKSALEWEFSKAK